MQTAKGAKHLNVLDTRLFAVLLSVVAGVSDSLLHMVIMLTITAQ
jgi:hypothetical protein